MASKEAEDVKDVKVEEKKDEKTDLKEEKKNFSLELFAIIRAAQQQYGLRRDDFTRYRQYCARRLHRLRDALNLLHARKDFKKKPIEVKHVTDAKVLHIPLLMAERAWAYAEDINQEINSSKDNTHVNTRLKFHALKRLKKATRHSQELLALVNATADPKSKLEAEAYAAWMAGNVARAANDYVGGLKKYNQAVSILEQLAKLALSTTGPGLAALYTDTSNNMTYAIKACEQWIQALKSAGMTKTAAVSVDLYAPSPNLEKILTDLRDEQAKASVMTLNWQGKNLPVESEKIRAKLNEAKEKAEKSSKVEELAELMSLYDNTIQTVRAELPVVAKIENKAVKQDKENNLNNIIAYVNYHKLRAKLDRNSQIVETMAATLQKQQDEEFRARELIAQARLARAEARRVKKAAQAEERKKLREAMKQTKKQQGGKEATATATPSSTAAKSGKKGQQQEEKKEEKKQEQPLKKKEKKVKPDDVADFYDRLLEIINDLKAKGASSDATLSKQLVAQTAFFQAFRTFYLGESYRAVNKFQEAVALYQRAVQVVGTSTTTIQSSGVAAAPAMVARLAELVKKAQAAQANAHASAILDTFHKARAASLVPTAGAPAAQPKDAKDNKESKEKKDSKTADQQLREPTPSKPSFFDLAFNGIQYPNVESRIKPKPVQQQKSMLARFFGR